MLDSKFIYQNLDKIEAAALRKRILFDSQFFKDMYEIRLEAIKRVEDLRKLRNQVTKETGALLKQVSPEQKDAILAQQEQQNRDLGNKLQTAEETLRNAETQFKLLMLKVPNIPSSDTPNGASDLDNVELRTVGALPAFKFEPKTHIELGSKLGIIDFERGAAIAGARSYYLTGIGAELERAVQTLALDVLKQRGYKQFSVPTLVKSPAMEGTGYLPNGANQAYYFEADDLWLVGTAEVPLTSYYRDQIINQDSLPIKMCAWSNCYRREAGAAGKDTKGLYRVHQFQKIEQVVICPPDTAISDQLHAELLANAEQILQLLELPYRVVQVCTGDLGQGQVKKNDIETWMPSRNGYGETHSCSSFYDFQARRLNIKARKNNKNEYCFTLNNTAVATPRILIPLLECHQQADGTIRLPKALQKIMNREFITNEQ